MSLKLTSPYCGLKQAGAKPMRTEFGIHHRLESCVGKLIDGHSQRAKQAKKVNFLRVSTKSAKTYIG